MHVYFLSVINLTNQHETADCFDNQNLKWFMMWQGYTQCLVKPCSVLLTFPQLFPFSVFHPFCQVEMTLMMIDESPSSYIRRFTSVAQLSFRVVHNYEIPGGVISKIHTTAIIAEKTQALLFILSQWLGRDIFIHVKNMCVLFKWGIHTNVTAHGLIGTNNDSDR